MAINRKEKGNRRERQVKQYYERIGFMMVKSGGSFGPFDLVGCNGHHWVCIQVKANKRPSSKEIKEMRAVRVPPKTIKSYVVIHDGQPNAEQWECGEI